MAKINVVGKPTLIVTINSVIPVSVVIEPVLLLITIVQQFQR